LQIRIEAVDLPGSSCGPSPEVPDGYGNIHVAVQGRKGRDDLLDCVPATVESMAWVLEARVNRSDDRTDLQGRYLQGPPGGRFIYLTWGTVDDGGTFTMFRRAKLWMVSVPAEVMEDAVAGGLLVGRVGLTDPKGNPRCGAVRPPDILWSAPT
jgi:Family of unknown function (DUF5990)